MPFTPIVSVFGFARLPAAFVGILVLMVATYLLLVEVGKRRFFRGERPGGPLAARLSHQHRRIRRVATRWSDPASVAAR